MKIFDINGKELMEIQDDSLQWAKLRGSNLQEAKLQGSDLRWAELQGSDLRGSDLQGSDLQWAELQGSDLRGSDLRGAKLQGSDLRGAKLQGANIDYAAFQLSCKILSMKTDEKQRIQFAFHFVSLIQCADNATDEEKNILEYLKPYVNRFHRDDVERIK